VDRTVLRDGLYKEIGKRIARARGDAATQLELARGIGVSRPVIANIERGEQQIYVHQLVAIAQHLQLPIGDLLPTRPLVALPKADVSVSGDKLNRSQEKAVKELVTSITQSRRR